MALTKRLQISIYLLLGCVLSCAPRSATTELDAKSPNRESSGENARNLMMPTEKIAPLPEPITTQAPAVIPPDKPTQHFTLPDDQGRPIEVYPPVTKTQKAPLVVLLHATCMQPAWVCDWVGNAGRDNGWLVCPSGNSTCAGEPDWHGPGPEKAAFLENALQIVEASVSTFVDEQPGVLIGWSRGAFAARDILYSALDDAQSFPHAKRFKGLVLMAAAVKPDPSKLQSLGITRVVMAAGDYDGAKSSMVAAVTALQAAGLEARYVSLGKIAHVWPNDFEARMREPIAWAGRVTP